MKNLANRLSGKTGVIKQILLLLFAFFMLISLKAQTGQYVDLLDYRSGFAKDVTGNLYLHEAYPGGIGYDCNKVFNPNQYYCYRLSQTDNNLKEIQLKQEDKFDGPQWIDYKK